MKSLLINTAPQQQKLYAIKKHDGSAFPLPFHMHERYELTYIVKGKGTRIIGDRIAEYKEGDLVLVAPHTPHQWQSSMINPNGVSAITLFFSNDFPTKEFQDLPEFKNIRRLLDQSKFGIELQGELRKNVAKQIAKLPNEYSLTQLMRILSILNEISHSGEYRLLMDKGFTVSKKQDYERVTKLVNYISQHLSEKITIPQLAEITCLHPGSITRFFKQATGFSLVEYINLMRIGMACQLLAETNKTIFEISLECGFNNLSNFNRVFKRIKKTAPGEYRTQFL